MEPAKKAARTSCIQARLPFISSRALSILLQLAKDEDLPQSTSRRSLRRARDKDVQVKTPYGELHQHIRIEAGAGKEVEVEVQHPYAMLWHTCRHSQGLASLLHPILSSPENGPAKPLSLILYMDEVMPGNPLAVTAERKLWAVYWSILELGSAALSQEDNDGCMCCFCRVQCTLSVYLLRVALLCSMNLSSILLCSSYMHTPAHEDAWFELFLLRTSTVKEIAGGLGKVFTDIIKLFFCSGHNPSTAGVSLQLHTGLQTIMWLKLGQVIADEAALHMLWGAKGASGLKPCMLCLNVFNRLYRAEARAIMDTDGLTMDHDDWDASKMILHTPGSLASIVRRISAPMPKTHLAALETDLGWNLAPESILWHNSLLKHCHPCSSVLFDWMHVFLVGGVFNTIALAVLMVLVNDGITWEHIDAYVSAWTLPSAVQSKIDDVFKPRRLSKHKDAGELKCTASECLSLTQVLAHFMQEIVSGSRSTEVKRHALCYLLMVRLIELLQRSSRAVVAGIEYTRVCQTFLKLCKELFGSEVMTPKFHSALHFGRFLDTWRHLPNCFVLERKHRFPKRWANQTTNTKHAYEGQVLRMVTAHHCEALIHDPSVFSKEARLLQPREPTAKLAKAMGAAIGNLGEIIVAHTARINEFEGIQKGDMTLIGTDGSELFGTVEHLFEQTGLHAGAGPLAFVRLFAVRGKQTRCWQLASTEEAGIVLVKDIRCALTWSGHGAAVVALMPSWMQTSVV